MILDKRQMYALLRAGAFGNTLRTWNTAWGVYKSGYRGRIALRSLVPGGPFLPFRNLYAANKAIQKTGAEGVVWCEMFPDHELSLQGEVMEDSSLVLAWSDEKSLTMREAQAKGLKHSEGLCAREILRARLSPASYDDLMELLELYPGHVIEFSAAECFVGSCRGRNAVVWEVRRY